MSGRIRVVLGAAGADGPDRGVETVARALRDAGMEVVYPGSRQTPEQLVATAVQEDADLIGFAIPANGTATTTGPDRAAGPTGAPGVDPTAVPDQAAGPELAAGPARAGGIDPAPGADQAAGAAVADTARALFARVLDLLADQDAAEVIVFGGGHIPPEDVPALLERGVRAVFPAGTASEEIVGWVRSVVAAEDRA